MKKFLRKTMEYPEGIIVHAGDCTIYSMKICICGLFHIAEGIDPSKINEMPIYPKFWDDFDSHFRLMTSLEVEILKKRDQ